MREKRRRPPGRALALALVLSLGPVWAGAGQTAWAASPEFAYSPEKWAALRDDVIQYEELSDLIHEYNAQVQSNEAAYASERGKSNDAFKNDYQNSANRLYESSDQILDGADEEQAAYASALMSSVNTRIQAIQMEERASQENSDGRVKGLEYRQQEASLVQNAQSKMNQYWQKVYEIQGLESTLSLAEAKGQSAVLRRETGLESRAQTSQTLQEAEDAKARLAQAREQKDSLARELQVMLGWSHDAAVEIQEIPLRRERNQEPGDLETDKQKALENNYLLQAASRRRELSVRGSAQETKLQITTAQARENIQADVENRRRLLDQARAEAAQAQLDWELEEKNFQTVSRKRDLGLATRLQYLEAQDGLAQKEVSREISALKLFQAQEDYAWSVNGLGDTGGL